MMFFGGPIDILFLVIGLPLIFIPQWWVKSTYEKYAQVVTLGERRGADVAMDILRHQGINNVTVEMSHGILSDHYDPIHRTVRLSEANYHGTSVSAVAVAAHEVGHAIQHARGFFPVVVRSAMVPAVNLGSRFGPLLILASFLLMAFHFLSPSLGVLLAWFGVILFGLAVAFHFVTLPVEIDASMRALGVLRTTHYLSAQELPLAKKVLTAAAMTYVATALYALMALLRYVYLLNSRRE